MIHGGIVPKVESLTVLRNDKTERTLAELQGEMRDAMEDLALLEDLHGYAFVAFDINGQGYAYYHSGNIPASVLADLAHHIIEQEQ